MAFQRHGELISRFNQLKGAEASLLHDIDSTLVVVRSSCWSSLQTEHF